MTELQRKFYTADGYLTAYALACGYIERASDTGDYRTCNLVVDLWHEGAYFHIKAYDHKEGVRLVWESFHRLSDARKFWLRSVKTHRLTHHTKETFNLGESA